MERVVAGEVVAAVGRTDAGEPSSLGEGERLARQIRVLAVGKREVPDRPADDLLQLARAADEFVPKLLVVVDFAEVGMAARMTAHLDAGIGEGAKLLERVRRE